MLLLSILYGLEPGLLGTLFGSRKCYVRIKKKKKNSYELTVT